MYIMNNEHPFQPGAEVVIVRYHNGRMHLAHRSKVAKAHKNGIVKIEGRSMANFRPVKSESMENPAKLWSLREINSYASEYVYLASPGIDQLLEEDEVERRAIQVQRYLSEQFSSRHLEYAPEKLAKIVAILNE